MGQPALHRIGVFGVVGFSILIALVLIARVWFSSRDERRSKIAVELLEKIGGSKRGGPYGSREAQDWPGDGFRFWEAVYTPDTLCGRPDNFFLPNASYWV